MERQGDQEEKEGQVFPHTPLVVVVISGDCANQGMADLPVKEEVARCARLLLELRNTDYLVLDSEDKSGFMQADLAANLACLLQASCFTTSDLKAEYLRVSFPPNASRRRPTP